MPWPFYKRQIMQNNDIHDLEHVCIELQKTLNGVLNWQWDSRFEAMLAECNEAGKEKTLKAIPQSLPNFWDDSTIKKAPSSVKTSVKRFGGLMSGQMLFSSDPNKEPLLLCAWWPWNNGSTISVRIALLSCSKENASRQEELTALLKSFFSAAS